MKYMNGKDVSLSDCIYYHNQVGTIVICFESSEYSHGFNVEDWGFITEGILIKFENGALLHLSDLTNDDIKFIK